MALGEARSFEELSEIVLDRVALLIHRDLVLNCPVDTGRLRGSIAIQGMSTPAGASAEGAKDRAIVEGGKLVKGERRVGTNVEYAPDIEIRGGKDGKGKNMFLNASGKVRRFTDQVLRDLK